MVSVTAVATTLKMPDAERDGLSVPTLNGYGWASTKAIDPTPDFVKEAASSPYWALDIGCAYGIYVLAALEAGARVVANDLDARHLEILVSSVPEEAKDRIKTACGAFPNVELPPVEFGAILANRVLHFLDGPTLEAAARKMFEILVPGGKAFVRTVTPYLGTHSSIIPAYEKRKLAGERYPGFVSDMHDFVSHERELEVTKGQMHVLEPDTLARVFSEAGFVIERAEFGAVPVEPWKYDGRETTIVVARKP